jgi:hypothetical protein
MKNLKIALLAVLVLGAAAVAVAFKANPTPPKPFDGTIEYAWTGGAHIPAIEFVIGTTSSSELSNPDNFSTTIPSCTGSTRLCKVTVTYTGSPSPLITEQQILDQLKAHYDASSGTPKSFSPNPWDYVLNGVTYHFTVTEKS